ncbi:hypothetical protein BsIDN1_41610 [Bacillus safensis]|uniref:Phosphotransferase system EIIC domain-containing protein n=1 Tax=Bacillus safensis TaxID=561879 RepID=A0A5S9MBQ3_BACIA|nr:hypothetical protein BsIDN1_41610 [Bacillus safensis]
MFTILIFLKSKQLKQVAKLGLGPGLFNVNEPIIFGLPIVMNPLILIPWILAPMVITCITYFCDGIRHCTAADRREYPMDSADLY